MNEAPYKFRLALMVLIGIMPWIAVMTLIVCNRIDRLERSGSVSDKPICETVVFNQVERAVWSSGIRLAKVTVVVWNPQNHGDVFELFLNDIRLTTYTVGARTQTVFRDLWAAPGNFVEVRKKGNLIVQFYIEETK